jgi:hypothetical protein
MTLVSLFYPPLCPNFSPYSTRDAYGETLFFIFFRCTFLASSFILLQIYVHFRFVLVVKIFFYYSVLLFFFALKILAT